MLLFYISYLYLVENTKFLGKEIHQSKQGEYSSSSNSSDGSGEGWKVIPGSLEKQSKQGERWRLEEEELIDNSQEMATNIVDVRWENQ